MQFGHVQIRNDSSNSFFPFDRADERFRQTIMNYHEPFDRKHDSQ